MGLRLGVISGKPYRVRSSYDAVRMGIVMVPENRRTEGLILDESVRSNIVLPALRFISEVWLSIKQSSVANK